MMVLKSGFCCAAAARTLLAIVVLCTPISLFAQEKGPGPMSLFITYQCPAANKAAFRALMADSGVSQFENWRKAGVFENYLILFSSFVNTGPTAPDMLVRIDFARYADSAKWKEIETVRPAGLSPDALALCTPVTSYLADLNYQGRPSPTRDMRKAVYLWIPYHLEKGVSKSQYKKYFEVYVKPQNDAWLEAGALSWWGVYFNQHNTGTPWDMIFLYEYADINGLSRRDNVKESVRQKLREDPIWKQASDNKQSVRIEDQVIIMDPIVPRK